VTRLRWTFIIAAVVTVAIVFVLWRRAEERRLITNPTAVALAEDEVYEAVVQHVYVPDKKNGSVTRLVFSRIVDTYLCPGADKRTCLDGVRRRLKGAADGSIHSETIDNFITQSEVPGILSTTFRTELPKTFVDPNSLYFDFIPIDKKGQKSFYDSFSESSGLISFSHVGFDSTLHEAIVSTSIVCGGLCGTGRRYVLRKKWGKWEVVDAWVVWIS
jgi:hypothetical protein